MTKAEVQLTDPSRELGLLSLHFRGFPGSNENGPAYQAISEAIGVNASSADFLEAVAEIRVRLQDLEEFAQQISDPNIDDELRRDVASATRNFANMFAPAHLSMAWKEAKQRFVQDAN